GVLEYCLMGAGKASGGSRAVASDMNCRQILAGYVAPNTVIPPTFVIGISPDGFPIQTAAVNWGVYPTNQASWLWSVVPVLPAAGRSKLPRVALAVPLFSTCLSMLVSVRATLGSSTCTPTVGAW